VIILTDWEPASPYRLIVAVILPLVISQWGYHRKNLSASGAAAGEKKFMIFLEFLFNEYFLSLTILFVNTYLHSIFVKFFFDNVCIVFSIPHWMYYDAQ